MTFTILFLSGCKKDKEELLSEKIIGDWATDEMLVGAGVTGAIYISFYANNTYELFLQLTAPLKNGVITDRYQIDNEAGTLTLMNNALLGLFGLEVQSGDPIMFNVEMSVVNSLDQMRLTMLTEISAIGPLPAITLKRIDREISK